jgi:heme oxygenase
VNISADLMVSSGRISYPGLRIRLREATAAAHKAVDLLAGSLRLTTLVDYRRFLEASAAALIPLEAAVEYSGVNSVLKDWSARSRTGAIRIDLSRIGGHVRPLDISTRMSRDEMIGSLYVVEGSRLGARYLMRAVTSSPDPIVAGAIAYLSHGSGEALWPAFLSFLDREGSSVNESAAIASATAAFNLFREAFART